MPELRKRHPNKCPRHEPGAPSHHGGDMHTRTTRRILVIRNQLTLFSDTVPRSVRKVITGPSPTLPLSDAPAPEVSL